MAALAQPYGNRAHLLANATRDTAVVPQHAVPQEFLSHLKMREGDRDSVYQDNLGRLTAGIGHCLTAAEQAIYKLHDPVPADVREAWAVNDTQAAYAAAVKQASILGVTDEAFVIALASVNFQLGTAWYKEHKKTWALMMAHEWHAAAIEAQDSRWYRQTKVRVQDFQHALRALSTKAAPVSPRSVPVDRGFIPVIFPPLAQLPKDTPAKPKAKQTAASTGGTPLFSQGDVRWKNTTLGKAKTFHAAGCAVTATTMAVSAISGTPMDPAQMDAYLDVHDGYAGDLLKWSVAAKAAGLKAARHTPFDIAIVDESLAAGRPCVISVNSNGHWVTVTRRHEVNGKWLYTIHDPAGGVTADMTLEDGVLIGAKGAHSKKSASYIITFSK